MTKGKIIGLSITLVLITLVIMLFSFVFCVREQEVSVVNGSPINVAKSEILTVAGIKDGSPIFMIDKEQATKNIENQFPYVKVIQIKTTGLTKINIIVRARVEMYYTKNNTEYYIFDEDLKLLKKSKDRPINLMQIEENTINITETTKECDFVGTQEQRNVLLNLYKAMTTTVTRTDGENEVYLSRTEISKVLKNIQFKNFETFNKVVITTSYGVKLDIETPTRDLDYKINICFSTIKKFIIDADDKEKSGTIRLFYDLNGHLQCEYYE